MQHDWLLVIINAFHYIVIIYKLITILSLS